MSAASSVRILSMAVKPIRTRHLNLEVRIQLGCHCSGRWDGVGLESEGCGLLLALGAALKGLRGQGLHSGEFAELGPLGS